jgi:hypothetical protein
MNNYILQNENSVYFEAGYSCDNVIYLSISGDNYFITDARYEIEAKLFTKNCEVIISNDLIKSARKIRISDLNATLQDIEELESLFFTLNIVLKGSLDELNVVEINPHDLQNALEVQYFVFIMQKEFVMKDLFFCRLEPNIYFA